MSFAALRGRLYGLGFVDEFGPLYALYTLWFDDNGISAAQISTVFLLWAAVGIVLEIPSGAVADRVDRRHLLAVAFGLRAAGISVWLVSPTYGGVLAGAVLWAVHSALASGAWEAQIHDQLTAIERETGYPTVMARVGQFSYLGIAGGTIVAAGALRLGASIELLGWLTVAIHGVSILLVESLPDVRWVVAADRAGDGAVNGSSPVIGPLAAWLATLRTGFRQVLDTGAVLRLVLLGGLLEGLFVVDEYVPLLARERGAGDSLVPVFVLVVFVGLLAGGELAARRPGDRGPTLGAAMVIGASAMLVAVQSSSQWALVLVGVGYATLELVWIASDGRLQERVASKHRATVTSVRGFLSGIVATIAFAVIGAQADGSDPRPGLLLVTAVLIGVGLVAMSWLPGPRAALERPAS